MRKGETETDTERLAPKSTALSGPASLRGHQGVAKILKTVAGGGTSTVSGDNILDTQKCRSVKTSAFNFFRTTYPLTPTPLSNSTEFALIP